MRAALYFSPPEGHPLARAAAAWLGRDAWTGALLSPGDDSGLPAAALARLTAAPRRYGFHATLKPPFRLAPGRTMADLRTALADFARSTPSAAIEALRLARLGPFFALVPDGGGAGLRTLADAVVRGFDAFRTPPTGDEIARRRPGRLTPRQRALLAAWGYPYVFDEFRFHMTLTGPVSEAERDAVEELLRVRFAAFIGQPLAVDRLCLFVEPRPPGDFVIDAAAQLGG